MSSWEQFGELIGTLYDAAGSPELWPAALARITDAFDATQGVLVGASDNPALHRVELHGYSDHHVQTYLSHYQHCDLLLLRGMQRILDQGSWVGAMDSLVPQEEWLRSEIFNDYVRPIGMKRQISAGLLGEGSVTLVGMGLWRSGRNAEFSDEDLRLLQLVTPHVRRAFALQAKLSELQVEGATLRLGLEAAGVAVAGLDFQGRVVTASDAARRLLEAGNGVYLDGKEIRARDPETDVVLRMVIARSCHMGSSAVSVEEVGSGSAGGAVVVPRGNAKRPLQVVVMPYRGEGIGGLLRPAALVFLSDPGSTTPDRSWVLQEVFGLSAAQVRLVMLLVAGVEMKEAAEILCSTYESLRFQLKDIFRKTGTRRQTELVRVVLGLPGV